MMRKRAAVTAAFRACAAGLLAGAAIASLAAAPGCYRAARDAGSAPAPGPPPVAVALPGARESSPPAAAQAPPAAPPSSAPAAAPAPEAAREGALSAAAGSAVGSVEERGREGSVQSVPRQAAPPSEDAGPSEGGGHTSPSVGAPAESRPTPGGETASAGGTKPSGREPGTAVHRPGNGAQARSAVGVTVPIGEPEWVRRKEELRFRVRFLGMTVGHATFSWRGRVMLDGREAYLLSVRAETSGSLSLIYPVKQAIDYYVDPATLAPLRQEYLIAGRGRGDEVIYDQKKGKIIYRDRKTGEISRRVDVVPNIYDPVTVAYYFRVRDLGSEERAQAIYAGRKVWTVATRVLGTEEVDTPRGRREAVLVQPVIMRDGRVEDKGTLRMWMTRDERRVPVRVYAKFRKILDWVLLAELEADEKGG